MSGQMSPRGGSHPGKMPSTKTGSKGGKSPKVQAGNRPGYGRGGERGEERSERS